MRAAKQNRFHNLVRKLVDLVCLDLGKLASRTTPSVDDPNSYTTTLNIDPTITQRWVSKIMNITRSACDWINEE